jgi:NAD(P)-dependent dehydrogenase (short-subunit alcohol dehydrogenase family)
MWTTTIDIDLKGPWLGMKAVLPALCERGAGSIVNFSSTAAGGGIGHLAAYTAAKGGIEALTRQAAVEYGPQGIRVNAIAPGPIATPALRTPNDMGGIPARRIGRTADICAGVAFLLSDAAGYITGTILPVDGGLSATHASLVSPPPGT